MLRQALAVGIPFLAALLALTVGLCFGFGVVLYSIMASVGIAHGVAAAVAIVFGVLSVSWNGETAFLFLDIVLGKVIRSISDLINLVITGMAVFIGLIVSIVATALFAIPVLFGGAPGLVQFFGMLFSLVFWFTAGTGIAVGARFLGKAVGFVRWIWSMRPGGSGQDPFAFLDQVTSSLLGSDGPGETAKTDDTDHTDDIV
jgi:hypothetical protein